MFEAFVVLLWCTMIFALLAIIMMVIATMQGDEKDESQK